MTPQDLLDELQPCPTPVTEDEVPTLEQLPRVTGQADTTKKQPKLNLLRLPAGAIVVSPKTGKRYKVQKDGSWRRIDVNGNHNAETN